MIWQVVCHYEELWAKLGPINFLSCVDEKAGLVWFWRLKEPFEKDSPELPYVALMMSALLWHWAQQKTKKVAFGQIFQALCQGWKTNFSGPSTRIHRWLPSSVVESAGEDTGNKGQQGVFWQREDVSRGQQMVFWQRKDTGNKRQPGVFQQREDTGRGQQMVFWQLSDFCRLCHHGHPGLHPPGLHDIQGFEQPGRKEVNPGPVPPCESKLCEDFQPARCSFLEEKETKICRTLVCSGLGRSFSWKIVDRMK